MLCTTDNRSKPEDRRHQVEVKQMSLVFVNMSDGGRVSSRSKADRLTRCPLLMSSVLQKKAQAQQAREFHKKSIKEKAAHLSGLFTGGGSAESKVTARFVTPARPWGPPP